MSAYGIPHEDIARLIINPETKAGISSTTLRQHFRSEIDTGLTKANTKVIGAMFKNATTGTKAFPGGVPVIQIFWAKARMGWQGKDENLLPPPQAIDKLTPLEVVRRIAFLLHKAGKAQREPVTIDQAARHKVTA